LRAELQSERKVSPRRFTRQTSAHASKRTSRNGVPGGAYRARWELLRASARHRERRNNVSRVRNLTAPAATRRGAERFQPEQVCPTNLDERSTHAGCTATKVAEFPAQKFARQTSEQPSRETGASACVAAHEDQSQPAVLWVERDRSEEIGPVIRWPVANPRKLASAGRRAAAPLFASLALRGFLRRLGRGVGLVGVGLVRLGGGEDREVVAVQIDSVNFLAVLIEAALLQRATR